MFALVVYSKSLQQKVLTESKNCVIGGNSQWLHHLSFHWHHRQPKDSQPMVLTQLQRSKAQQRCQLSWNLISDNSWVLIMAESLGLGLFSCFLHENLNKTAIY
jgi:hypothetical protein